MAEAISKTHEIGKYPIQEKKERRNHLGLKIGLGVGVASVLSFLGYKALTNNNQVSTEEVQAALAPQDKKVEVVKRNYGQEAVKDLNAGVLPIEDYGSYYEVGKYTQKDNPDRGPDFWNSVYGALVKYDLNLEGKKIKFTGLDLFGRKRMNHIIEPDVKNPTKDAFPDFEAGFKVYARIEDGTKRYFFAVQNKSGAISVYEETVSWK